MRYWQFILVISLVITGTNSVTVADFPHCAVSFSPLGSILSSSELTIAHSKDVLDTPRLGQEVVLPIRALSANHQTF